MTSGACLCGAVTYEVDGPVEDLTHCHCGTCRKLHGAPFASFVEAPASAFRWTGSSDAIASYAAPGRPERPFCETCGAAVPSVVGDRVRLPAANLIGGWGDAGGRHVCVGSMAPWYTIGDALPRHADAPPGWDHVATPSRDATDGTTPGSCSCGAVAFRVSGVPARWFQCHCSRCRRGRSAAHGSNTFFPVPDLAWERGRDLVRAYKVPEAERFTVTFCTRCGGAAPVVRDAVPFVVVPAGLFDADPGGRPQAHIHVASDAGWYRFDDGLPRFDELPPL